MKCFLSFVLRSGCIALLTINTAFSGDFGLGVGSMADRPEYIGVDNDHQILPIPSYQGKRLEIGIEGVSWLLLGSGMFQLKVEARGRFDGYDPGDSPDLRGMDKKDSGIDSGVSLTMKSPWGEAKFAFLQDISGASKGHEYTAAYQFPMQQYKWSVSPGMGVKLSSAKLVDYYYGVNADEATEVRPEYQGSSSMDVFVGTNIGYQLSASSQFLVGMEYTFLGDEKRNSPIVDQNSSVVAFAAYLYMF